MRRALLAVLFLALPASVAAQEASEAPDLSIPGWHLCPAPAGIVGVGVGTPLACYTQDEVRQILRVQEHARYALQVGQLRLRIIETSTTLVAELEAAQASYAALRQVIEERNGQLNDRLREAEATTERYRLRLERRRIWPWVTLGLGTLLGLGTGLGIAL